jgi:hypothetical protein
MKRELVRVLLVLQLIGVAGLHAQDIRVDARQVIGHVPRLLTGACIEDVNHEIYGGLYSQMIFGESFQEPPPPPTVAGFTAFGGRWLLDGGVVHVAADDGPKLVSDASPFGDGAVGVDLKFADASAGNAGLIVRVDKPAAGADRFVGYEISLNAQRRQVRLARHRNNFELIRDVACEVPVGRWFTLEVRLSGPVIEILVDAKPVLRHDDAGHSQPAGTVGLRCWRREASYRNLWTKTGADVERRPFAEAARPAEVSGMWRPVRQGSAIGQFALTPDRPFAGGQSQLLFFNSGDGEWGIENQGLNRWGLNFVAERPYEGYVWVRAEEPTTVFAALESRDGSRCHAEKALDVTPGGWRRLDFLLTPNATDARGRFALKLKRTGSVTVGHAFLQPGEWGRFKGLSVRRDVAEGLINQGITVLRYGGSMVNTPEYRWKKMIGARDRRPPYHGFWYRYASNGWGIPDFMALCEAAGFEYVPTFDVNETPQDMADFVEYAKGPIDSEWGRKRAADGHSRPYRLRYVELGNEERVDERFAAKFEAIARAIWAKDPEVILVVGDFAYDRPITDPMKISGAASKIATLGGHAKILALARECGREVWFDVHLDTDGPAPSSSLDALPTYIDALHHVSGGARHKVVVFEFNSGNHAMRRALANAQAINRIERDGRVPIATSANGLQPDGQNDNGWDQGLLFLNPSQVWLQPPGYVTQMASQHYLPQVVRCKLTEPSARLDVTAKRDPTGSTLQLQVVSLSDQPITATIHLDGFVPTNPIAEVTELSSPLDAVNTADRPGAVVPRRAEWKHMLTGGASARTFPPHSFTIIRWR